MSGNPSNFDRERAEYWRSIQDLCDETDLPEIAQRSELMASIFQNGQPMPLSEGDQHLEQVNSHMRKQLAVLLVLRFLSEAQRLRGTGEVNGNAATSTTTSGQGSFEPSHGLPSSDIAHGKGYGKGVSSNAASSSTASGKGSREPNRALAAGALARGKGYGKGTVDRARDLLQQISIHHARILQVVPVDLDESLFPLSPALMRDVAHMVTLTSDLNTLMSREDRSFFASGNYGQHQLAATVQAEPQQEIGAGGILLHLQELVEQGHSVVRLSL